MFCQYQPLLQTVRKGTLRTPSLLLITRMRFPPPLTITGDGQERPCPGPRRVCLCCLSPYPPCFPCLLSPSELQRCPPYVRSLGLFDLLWLLRVFLCELFSTLTAHPSVPHPHRALLGRNFRPERGIDNRDAEHVVKYLRNTRVFATHSPFKRQYRIGGLSNVPANRETFDWEGKQVSVVDYFEQHYKIRLQYVDACSSDSVLPFVLSLVPSSPSSQPPSSSMSAEALTSGRK